MMGLLKSKFFWPSLFLFSTLILSAFIFSKGVYAYVACDAFDGSCKILSPGNYTVCTPSIGQCNPEAFAGQTCNNGPTNTNSNFCGTPCLQGNPWTRYQSVCYLSSTSTNPIKGLPPINKCGYGIVQTLVCSTADKYQPNSVYLTGVSSILDAGTCSCGVGGAYKACCGYDSTTGVYSKPVNAIPSQVSQPPYPKDGNCPGSYIDSNGTSETVITTPPGTTSCQTPPQPSSYSFSVYSDPSGISIDTSLWGSQKTSFTKTTTNTSVSFSAPATLTIGGQTYSFSYWNYGTNRVTSPSISNLSLKAFSSASAYYVTSTKYYYCKTSTTPNSCAQTSNLYPSVTACEKALKAVSSTGICYPTQNACQQDPQCAPASSATYYYCSSNSCVSGKYSSISACNAANGTCYISSSCNSACGTPPPPPPSGGSGNIAINISASEACLPQGGTNNSTNINWSISGPSCPAGQTLSSGSTQLSCSSNIPGGPTGSGSGGSSVSVSQTTNFGISCSYQSFTCSYPCNPTTEVTTTPSGATTTITIWQTCFNTVNGSSASKSTTVYYVQPPTIYSFASNPQNILINKATTLSWAFQVPGSGTPTGQYCYPSGGNGDLSGWNSGQQYQSYQLQTNNLYPKQNTTYNITCRNYATGYSNCYNESTNNTNVNVYQSNLQESNPAALIENAFGGFLKKVGL